MNERIGIEIDYEVENKRGGDKEGGEKKENGDRHWTIERVWVSRMPTGTGLIHDHTGHITLLSIYGQCLLYLAPPTHTNIHGCHTQTDTHIYTHKHRVGVPQSRAAPLL